MSRNIGKNDTKRKKETNIYPGATFSTVPAKRYECPSLLFLIEQILNPFTYKVQRNELLYI